MELLSSIRESKLFYLGLPTLLLVLYVFLIPSPSVSQIQLHDTLGYIAEGYDFTILSISPDGQITRKSSLTFPYRVKNFTIENRLAYVITGDNSMHIIDISNSSNPEKHGEWNSQGIAHSIAINGGFAYVANDSDGVRIVSVNDSYSPSELMHINNLGTVLDVATAQNLIYVARGPAGLDIYDTVSITQSVSRGHYKTDGSINQITLLPENRALLLVDNRQIQIINFGNLQNIGLTNSFSFDTEIAQAVLSGKRIFVAQKSAGLLIARIKDDGTLERFPNFNTPYSSLGVAAVDNVIFIAAGAGGIQAVDISKLENARLIQSDNRFFKYKLSIGILIGVVLLFWLSFFAQFVLPVRTFSQRQKIFGRLLIFLIGRHGPATLIENGVVQARKSERQRKGPGVMWLDTASATVIRTATKFNEAIGPGVHFTGKKDFIAGTVDLHTQVDSLGPGSDEENPFMPKPSADADQTKKDRYDKIQKQRMEVSAFTRDGIEVVPKISVTFRVDTMPAEGNQQPGSRFGYRTGTSKKEKENEAKDKEAIYKAVRGEGINPNAPATTPRHRVAWNHLPILLAVDVWREYVTKFTLDELFTATQEVPPSPPTLPQPTDEEVAKLNEAVHVGAKQEPLLDSFESILRELNKLIATWLEPLESKKTTEDKKPKTESYSTRGAAEPSKKTGLQIINEMVKARLTLPSVEELHSTGHRTGKPKESFEYQLLSKRGLKVLNASISNPRVDDFMEKQLISQWTASWLNNAKAERDRIDRKRGFVEIQAQEQGMNEYVHALARHIMRLRPNRINETIKALLTYTRLMIVRNNHLRQRMSTEREELEEILQAMENT